MGAHIAYWRLHQGACSVSSRLPHTSFGLRKYAGGTGIEWPTVEYAPMPGLPPLSVEPWRGELGLEPTPEMFIAHLILCLREWRRVLRDDGTAWVNLGDSYNTRTSGNGRDSMEWVTGGNPTPPAGTVGNHKISTPGIPPKNLMGIPWRFAFAAQADGWYLRSDMIWAKPNPMPESVTSRPTKSHEYIFLLAKSERYFYDADAVREDHKRLWDADKNGGSLCGTDNRDLAVIGGHGRAERKKSEPNPNGRNLRSVLHIATQPTPFAHFATFPERIPEIAILAGTSAHGCCSACGKAWVRVVEKEKTPTRPGRDSKFGERDEQQWRCSDKSDFHERKITTTHTTGWAAQCTCDAEVVPCTVLDPFVGSGTTLRVAAKLGRNGIGVDVSESYLGDIVPQRMGDGIQMELSL